LWSYYWKEIDFKESVKRIKICDTEFKDKEDMLKFTQEQANIQLHLLEELPYEIHILKCKDERYGGAVLFKFDHSMTDGLGLMTFAMALGDNYDLKILPDLIKNKNNKSFLNKLAINFIDFLKFPYFLYDLIFFC